MNTTARPMSLSERADELEHKMTMELERLHTKSALFFMGDGKVAFESSLELQKKNPGKYLNMGDDPRLPKLPEKPTLVDFFKHRMVPNNHLLQSATHALKAGMNEKVVLACLLHDFAVVSFIRCDHGYWAAQMLEPYVDEEVSWGIRAHQSLRFFPDESVGYKYPEAYIKYFGPDYRPDKLMEDEYKRYRDHKWYMTGRLICIYDIYSFDPDAKVSLDDFIDIIGRNFKQPKEGLGYDNSPVAHMWRTLIQPTRFL
jgi:hypothetical protein